MRRTCQPILIIVLALALALVGGSRSMALAHGTVGQAMVICADGGEATIYIDASGNLVDPPMDCANCPDCMDNSVPILAEAGPVSGPDLMASADHSHPDQAIRLLSRHLRPQPRGPPLLAMGSEVPSFQAACLLFVQPLHLGSDDPCTRISKSFCS